MTDGTTNFCPHVAAGEPPCAACRGDDEPGEMDSLREQVAACGRLLDTQAAEIERLRAENAALKASVNGAWSEKMVQQSEKHTGFSILGFSIQHFSMFLSQPLIIRGVIVPELCYSRSIVKKRSEQ